LILLQPTPDGSASHSLFGSVGIPLSGLVASGSDTFVALSIADWAVTEPPVVPVTVAFIVYVIVLPLFKSTLAI